MMKPLKTILIFLAIFFIGQWVILNIMDALVSNSSFRFSKLYGGKSKMDNAVLCLGNSRGVNSFYTPYINQKYSTTSFNLSYNDLRMPMLDILLDDYLEKHLRPKTIFIEVSNVFNSDATTSYSAFNLYSAKSNTLNDRIKKSDTQTNIMNRIFPIYRYNSELLYRNIYYLSKSSDQNWINRYTILKELEDEARMMRPVDLDINNEDVLVLKKVVAKLKKADIEVCLFLAPYLPAYLKKIKNLKENIKTIEATTGLPVIDLSALLNDNQYFADKIHTNENGASFIADTLMNVVSR